MNETSPGPSRTEADADALRNQIAALLPDVRSFARFLLRDRAAADDLVQDGLLRALSAIDQFRNGSNLKAWLFTIVRNAFYETARRRKRETRLLGEHEAVAEQHRPAAEIRHELHDLQGLLWTLPAPLREALILVGAQEMTYDEAALICGVPIGTIKARVSRGRIALAAAIGRAEGHTDVGHDPRDT